MAPAYRDHDARVGSVNHDVGVSISRERFVIRDPRKRLLRATVMKVDADAALAIVIPLAACQQVLDDVRRYCTLRLAKLSVMGKDKRGAEVATSHRTIVESHVCVFLEESHMAHLR